MIKNIVLINLFFVGIYCYKCPEKEVVFPCICTQKTQTLPNLSCSRRDFYMKDVIRNITLNGKKGVEQRFGKLYWTNGRQTNLTDDFFGNVSFQHIHMGTRRELTNISHISSNAFRGISHRIKTFVLRSEYMIDTKEIFSALTKLTIVEYIGIEVIGIQIIPENAFKTPEECLPLTNCKQNKLKSIDFRIGVNKSLIFLTDIESHAFYDLPNLVSLDLNNHDITRINKNAFAFRDKSEEILKLNLSKQWDKKLFPESFELQALESINRPVMLDLFGNHDFKRLPEQIFRPFLDSDPRNKIRLGMKMECGCGMYWLWKNRDKYKEQFIEWKYNDVDMEDGNTTFIIHCSKGKKHFWDKTEKNFNKCQNENKKSEL